MRILLVEDDSAISSEVAEALKRRGAAVDVFKDGALALDAPESCHYDCILLDLGLPGIDGAQLLTRWRKAKVNTPVIIITARDGLEDRVEGLDNGADDYIVKPFELSELEARIRAVMRRSGQGSEIVGLSNGELTLDPLSHEVKFKAQDGSEQSAPLTAREYSLLEALLRRPGAVLSRKALEDHIYAYGEEVESNAVEFIIYNLRRKIGSSAIRNVRGVGWKVAKGE